MSGYNNRSPSTVIDRMAAIFSAELAPLFRTERARARARQAFNRAREVVESEHRTIAFRIGSRGYLIDTEQGTVHCKTPIYSSYEDCYDFLHRVRDMQLCAEPSVRFYILVRSVYYDADEPTDADILDDVLSPPVPDTEAEGEAQQRTNEAIIDIVDILQSHHIISRPATK